MNVISETVYQKIKRALTSQKKRPREGNIRSREDDLMIKAFVAIMPKLQELHGTDCRDLVALKKMADQHGLLVVYMSGSSHAGGYIALRGVNGAIINLDTSQETQAVTLMHAISSHLAHKALNDLAPSEDFSGVRKVVAEHAMRRLLYLSWPQIEFNAQSETEH